MSDEYNPDIVTVVDDNGEEYTFEELDRIETDDSKYVALVPVFDDPEEMLEEDLEVIVLKVDEDEDGDTYLSQIASEEEYARISAVFEERLSYLWNEEDEEDE
ncbi:MAG: DUF1292 domain-containing protein [Clostridia bacterium]|nr:DUF1292 domain-containing protein [Clostridia bacterium]